MAEVPYGQGVPQVAPEERLPDDYQHVNAGPEKFGFAKAVGEQQFGTGALEAGRFWGKVQTDDQLNNAQRDAHNLVEQYKKLNGADALNQQDDYNKKIDDIVKKGRDNLSTPEQQLQFDNVMRPFRERYLAGQMTSHAVSQGNEYAKNVNESTIKNAFSMIPEAADDEEHVKNLIGDAANAAVKNAELTYGESADQSVKNSAAQSKISEGYLKWLSVVAVEHPAKAQQLAEKYKAELGGNYAVVSNAIRARAEKQQGDELGKSALRQTYVPSREQVIPVLDNIGARYGVSGSYLQNTWQIEASGKFNPPDSSTGASGPFQFTRGTARQFGLQNPRDFTQSADAAARLAANNKSLLQSSLGRAPTDAELYLAHQQGAQGATLLLNHPTMRAGDLVGDKAIRVNGGDPNAPASAFTSMWTSRFNGAGLAMSLSRKASAYQIIASNPDIPENVRDHAISRVNRDIAMQVQAEEQTAQQRKLLNDQAALEYGTALGTGQPVDLNAMWNDPRISDIKTKEYIQALAEKKGFEDPSQYGPGYAQALGRISAKADDPSRITDISQILELELSKQVTSRGRAELTKAFSEIRNQKLGEHDPSAVNSAKSSLLKYAASKMGREQIVPGIGPMSTNKKGMEKYNSEFVPMFEDAYDKWVKSGKNPYEFLTRKKFDELIDGVYPPAERAKDSVSALNDVASGGEIPPAPHGVDADAWKLVMEKRPVTENGTQFSPSAWATAVNMLLANPTPETIKQFNASKFGKAGFEGNDIIRRLKKNQAAENIALP